MYSKYVDVSQGVIYYRTRVAPWRVLEGALGNVSSLTRYQKLRTAPLVADSGGIEQVIYRLPEKLSSSAESRIFAERIVKARSNLFQQISRTGDGHQWHAGRLSYLI